MLWTTTWTCSPEGQFDQDGFAGVSGDYEHGNLLLP
jgi:hypothetical protein